MKTIRDTTEDDMVSAFLKAEVNSVRWSESINKILAKHGVEKKIIDNPDLKNEKENETRQSILGDFRGYKRNEYLFKDFPENVNWKRIELDRDDLKKVKYIDYDYWVKLSGGSRLVVDAVKNIKKGVNIFGESNDQFWNLTEYIKAGGQFPEIILMENNFGELTLLEGHVRLTAYLLASENPNPIEVIIGYENK